tara:strand:+ start:533 stop:829 length:297 start_codon:yes stop_codon:yes gene_type:complete
MNDITTITWNEGDKKFSLVIDQTNRTVTYHEGGKLAYQSDDRPTVTKFEEGLEPLLSVLFRHHHNELFGTNVGAGDNNPSWAFAAAVAAVRQEMGEGL